MAERKKEKKKAICAGTLKKGGKRHAGSPSAGAFLESTIVACVIILWMASVDWPGWSIARTAVKCTCRHSKGCPLKWYAISDVRYPILFAYSPSRNDVFLLNVCVREIMVDLAECTHVIISRRIDTLFQIKTNKQAGSVALTGGGIWRYRQYGLERRPFSCIYLSFTLCLGCTRSGVTFQSDPSKLVDVCKWKQIRKLCKDELPEKETTYIAPTRS